MKKLILAVFILASITIDIDSIASESTYIDNNDIDKVINNICPDNTSHVKEIRLNNIVAYDVTCVYENHTIIHQYAPQQLIFTHYIKHWLNY